MEKPLISFILPYFNLPVPMLCECIDSILALSLGRDEREIIVIDDGSEQSPVDDLVSAKPQHRHPDGKRHLSAVCR